MIIQSTIKTRTLGEIPVVYRDVSSVDDLGLRKIQAVHAYCFYKGKLVIVWADDKKYWTLPGGRVEIGESVHEAVIREVQEESNMKVLQQQVIGVQDIFESRDKVMSQTRSFCTVEPYGSFVQDPDGDITQIKLIDPSELKEYVNWGEIGDHLLQRSSEILRNIET